MKSLGLFSPHLIIMVGMPGAGKTAFATKFADTFSAPHISRHTLASIGTDETAIHDVALELLTEIMKTKQTIVFDGDADMRDDRTELTKVAAKHGYKPLFIWVQADQDTAKQRTLKHSSVEIYKHRLEIFDPPIESEPYIVISGHHTYATQARTLLEHLSKQAPDSMHIKQPRQTTERARLG